MAATTRVAALVALVLAGLLIGVALFQPWWGLAREANGEKRWERYGPFQRDDRAEASEFRTETQVLGILTLGALAGLVMAFFATLASLRRSSRGRASTAWCGVACLLVVAAVVYAVVALPAEAQRERDRDLSFIDRECGSFGSVRLCYVTSPGLGWALAAGAGVLTLGAFLAPLVGRSDVEPEMMRAVGRPTPVAVVRPRTEPAVAGTPLVTSSSAPTRMSKCPQCQTRVTYRKPSAAAVLAECHNCGLRFPA